MNNMHHAGHKNIIHNRLREMRMKTGLSQEELAAKMQTINVNIDQQMISKIELDKRVVTDYEVVCFARVLKIAPGWLLDGYQDLFG